MNAELEREYRRIERIIEEPVDMSVIDRSISKALARLVRQGMPTALIERILRSARPLGDFEWFQRKLTFDEFNEFFGGPVRKYGIDGSMNHRYGCYGASTVPEILNLSPYKSSVDTYERMRGKKEKISESTQEIFYSGHKIEPVYRDYFQHMFGNRYIVFDCDIQWASRKYAHFIGNCDGLLYDRKTGELGVLEIKHTQPRNVPAIKGVQEGNTPAYWDCQQRCYMELLDADFSCIFLGWGNRPGLETNAMNRIERDRDLGESFLEQAEDFMTGNVETGIRPSYRSIASAERVRESIEAFYGPLDPSKEAVTIDSKNEKVLVSLMNAKDEITKAKEAKSVADEAVKAAEARFEALQLPILEELKNATSGEYKSPDGTRYYVSNTSRKTVDPERVRDLFPEEYDVCKKAAVNTEILKKKFPDVYVECTYPHGKRTFDIKAYR